MYGQIDKNKDMFEYVNYNRKAGGDEQLNNS